MIVVNKKKYLCSDCYMPYTYDKWCKECNTKLIQQDFLNWTSKNEFIDKFIQEAQLNAKSNNEILEWIPYNKFENIKYLNKKKSNTIYEAIWLDTPIIKWSYKKRKWIRDNKKRELKVVLKSLNYKSPNLYDLSFLNNIFSDKV